MEYEVARRMYEDGTTGFSSSIGFSVQPGFQNQKVRARASLLTNIPNKTTTLLHSIWM